MKIELIESEPEFLAIRDGWNSLTHEPLQSWEWNYWWWKHLGQDCQLRILTATKHGQICAVAPLVVSSHNGEIGARFLGSGKACTDHARLVVEHDDVAEFCHAIAEETNPKSGLLADVSLLEFEGVSPDSNVNTLCEQLGSRYWNYRIDLESTWLVPLPHCWESFVTDRHKSLRRKIRKAEKRYQSGEAVARSTKEGLDFESAFDTLVDLHQNRFESKGEPGVFSDERFAAFLRNAARDLVSSGDRAEIIVAEVQSEAIAAQLYLQSSRGPQMYQSGICSDHMDLEPGHLLFVHQFQKAIDNGCAEFDFLRGDDHYKHAWGGQPSPLYTIRCVSNRFPSTLKHQLLRGLHHLNSWTKETPFMAGR